MRESRRPVTHWGNFIDEDCFTPTHIQRFSSQTRVSLRLRGSFQRLVENADEALNRNDPA
jgi:hypothetical protein